MSATPSQPSPHTATSDPAQAFIAYLDFFRDAARRKVVGLDDRTLRESLLPSGWTPLQMISHLVHMERRWFVWGFLGEQVVDPWGDNVDGIASGRWSTDRTLDDLLTALAEGGRRTSEIVSTHDLLDHAASGGRFPDGEPTPTLIAILFHVMQEYARHLGHLDIVRELIDGTTGDN
ncbi:DinB family protein [Aeromicrobium sp.]|uniref:DinB family protein n=1 Tax=Aeromicrobium sp. TaxID=1871063 RepID=UPI002FCC51EB